MKKLAKVGKSITSVVRSHSVVWELNAKWVYPDCLRLARAF